MLCVNDRVKQLRLNHVYNMLLTICVIISFLLIKLTVIILEQVIITLYNLVLKEKKMVLFFVNVIKDWNNLPENVKVERGKINFKKSVKTRLFDEAKCRSL